MSRLKNKVAIITGAAGGMGLSTARLFFQEGAKVVVTDVQEELLKKEANAIGGGNDVLPLVLNVSSPESWKLVVENIWGLRLNLSYWAGLFRKQKIYLSLPAYQSRRSAIN